MNNELVSVIIPTYKRTTTLKRAIDSVIKQTYKNIEIIVVDDNSNFPKIRELNTKLISNYNNIVFIKNKKNLGGGLSRNEGLKRARGKFVAFLDDDDEFFPEKIQKQMGLYKSLNNNNIAMIYCFAKMIKTDGSFYISNRIINGNDIIAHVDNCIAATSWWFCPKSKILSVGGFEDISSRQDASLLLKLLLKGYEVYCVPEILLNYYKHDSKSGISSTSLKSIPAEKKYREIFEKNSKLLDEKTKKEVLYLFSFRIAHLYILLNNRKLAFLELKNMIRIKKISIRNLRILWGVIFNKSYCLISKIKNKKNN